MLFGFVRESLVDGWQPFDLIAPGGQKLQESEEVALAECNLVSFRGIRFGGVLLRFVFKNLSLIKLLKTYLIY